MHQISLLIIFIALILSCDTTTTSGSKKLSSPKHSRNLLEVNGNNEIQPNLTDTDTRPKPIRESSRMPKFRSLLFTLWNPLVLPWTNTVHASKIEAANSDEDVARLLNANPVPNNGRSSNESESEETIVVINRINSINETNLTAGNETTNNAEDDLLAKNEASKQPFSSTTVSSSTERNEKTLEKMKATTKSLPNTTKPVSSKRRLKPTESPIICEKFTENQLYRKLEKIGGRNQRFMANSPEEAGKNFADFMPRQNEFYEIDPDVFSDALPVNQGDDGCDLSCSEITQKLRDWLEDEDDQSDVEGSSAKLYDHGPAEVQEGKPGSYKASCHLEQFIPVSNCTMRGEEEIWGFEKLCSACHGVYMLSKDCFPRFLNSITCDNDDAKCIFDRVPRAHGKCQLRTLSFKVLRNKGTDKCENWVYEYIDVPIACECFLDKSSNWLSATES